MKLSNQEINDLLSALSFFISKYPDKKGSKITRVEMAKLAKRLWTELDRKITKESSK
jgi:hypothetical protein